MYSIVRTKLYTLLLDKFDMHVGIIVLVSEEQACVVLTHWCTALRCICILSRKKLYGFAVY